MTELETAIAAFKRHVAEVSQALEANILVITGSMQSPADYSLIEEMRKRAAAGQLKPNAFLLLTTYGGSADVAYRMARCLRHHYSGGRLIVFVDAMCKSAGTLLALSGNVLVISDSGELGPLDVQFRKPDVLGAQVSGLTPDQAFEFLGQKVFDHFETYFLSVLNKSERQITTKTASEIATHLTTGLFHGIYSQMDPTVLGEYHQNMKIAKEYGRRLNVGNLKDDALDSLIYNYPSHSFVIDRKEAESLFEHVRKPSDEEQAIADAMLNAAIVMDFDQMDAPAAIAFLDTDKIKDSDHASSPTEQNHNERDNLPEVTEK